MLLHECMCKSNLEICMYINLCVYVAKDVNTFRFACILVLA